MPAPALRPRGRRANFQGKHFRLEGAPNVPKPLQPRVSIWIGGRGEKRTLRVAAKYADGRNAPYLGPDEWIHKSRVLDQWCETEKRDPRTIRRTVNPGFSMGADAKGSLAGKRSSATTGARGATSARAGCAAPRRTRGELVAKFQDAGCARVNIAFRDGPYDWDARRAFAEDVVATS